MGNDLSTDPTILKQPVVMPRGDYDERPVHEVRISREFWMSETEITSEQFARFRFDHQDFGPDLAVRHGRELGRCNGLLRLAEQEGRPLLSSPYRS
jgi:formylglycine-generating enzyme required for sulfatase activity